MARCAGWRCPVDSNDYGTDLFHQLYVAAFRVALQDEMAALAEGSYDFHNAAAVAMSAAQAAYEEFRENYLGLR